MLERIGSWWTGKILVLVLLGFAATDFLITMTLSAADASTHLLENPYAPHFVHGHQLVVTLVLLVFAAIAFLVTWVFDADVDSQAGAYATGVLVLITSAAFAVTLSAYRRRDRMAWAYALITLVFAVTTVANMVERPDGLKIAAASSPLSWSCR